MKRFLLALLVLGLIGGGSFGGWKYWQDHHSSKTNSTTQKTNDPSEGGKYLVIKEWGVKMPLSAHLQNIKLQYELKTTNDTYKFEYATFLSNADSDLSSCLNISVNKQVTSSLPANFSPTNGPDSPQKVSSKVVIEDYTYYENRNAAFCDVAESERTKRAEATMDEISQAIASLQKYY